MITESKLNLVFVSETFVSDLMKLETDADIQSRIDERKKLTEGQAVEIDSHGARSVKTETVEEKSKTTPYDMDKGKPNLISQIKASGKRNSR